MPIHIRLAALIALLLGALLPQSSFAAEVLRAGTPMAEALATVDQILVKYRDVKGVAMGGVNAPIPAYRWLALQAQADRSNVRLKYLRNTALGSHVIRLEPPLSAGQARAFMASLQSTDPAVEYVQPDTRGIHHRAYHPNDPGFVPDQWNLHGEYGIRAREAWDEEWHGSTKEGERFFLPRLSLVRYGEYGRAGDPVRRWTYKLLEGGDAVCDNNTFGDPWVNVRKRCEVAKYWKFVTNEAHSFPLPDTTERWVRYGWGDSWAYKKLKGLFECSVATFGHDPAMYTQKICQVEDRADGGGILALELEQFYVPVPTVVRYGSISRTDGIGRWRYKLAPKGYNECSLQAFGGVDPYWGVRKRCERVRNMGEGVRIAIADTGYLSHVDLDANVDTDNGYDMIADPNMAGDGDGRDPFPDEISNSHCSQPLREAARAHGTSVAGVAAALINNGEYLAGIAPFATVQHVRTSPICAAHLSDAVDGWIWAVGGDVPGDGFLVLPRNQKPVRVINYSAGVEGVRCEPEDQAAVNFVRSKNAVLVAAAGNSGRDSASTWDWPLNCSGVIGVTGTNRSGERYAGANFGATIALAAPGIDVRVLHVDDAGTPGARTVSGNSIAAPQASAVAALMMSKNSKLTGVNVEHRLKLSARPFPKPCIGCGAGILDAARAMESAEAITEEQEPNYTGTPNHVTAPADIAGSADTSTDIDYYSLDLPPDATLKVQLVEGYDSFKVVLQDPQDHYRQVATLNDPKVGIAWRNMGTTTRRMLVRVATVGAVGAKYRITLQW